MMQFPCQKNFLEKKNVEKLAQGDQNNPQPDIKKKNNEKCFLGQIGGN